jgi:hypothetical protein
MDIQIIASGFGTTSQKGYIQRISVSNVSDTSNHAPFNDELLLSSPAARHARQGDCASDREPANVMLTNSGIKVVDFWPCKSSQDETAFEPREGRERDERT